ncbi:MAG TPA: histidine kinase [Vicinamibacteria bacterium]|nr:histidine kinase [Vicinamibacteria bacterium]
MSPLLAEKPRLAASLAAALPVGGLTVLVLTRGQQPFPLAPALLLALPLAALALAVLLPVSYVCRAVPVQESPLSLLAIIHGSGALLTSSLWVSAGAGFTRFLASTYPALDLPAVYRANVPDLLAGGALLYVLSASMHYMLIAVDATRRAEQQSLELAVLAREAELKALKAQVHPHFLFNSLNSISALTTSNPSQAREMCILLAEFFRKSLALGERPEVTLDDELTVGRAYLGIEGLRLGSRLRVDEAIDEAARRCAMPPLLLQPLLENAIRHGVATLPEGGVLRLEARTDGQRLRLLVENRFDPQAPARPGVGLGLANVQGRLRTRYGDGALVDARKTADAFRVVVVIPARSIE